MLLVLLDVTFKLNFEATQLIKRKAHHGNWNSKLLIKNQVRVFHGRCMHKRPKSGFRNNGKQKARLVICPTFNDREVCFHMSLLSGLIEKNKKNVEK